MRLGLWAFWLMIGGMFGMTMALGAAGITQTYLERIMGFGYLETQQKIQVHYLMWLATSIVFAAGVIAFILDFAKPLISHYARRFVPPPGCVQKTRKV